MTKAAVSAQVETAIILLHPAVETDLDEAALIQGHVIRFRTLDLTRPTPEISERLCGVLRGAELGYPTEAAAAAVLDA